MVLVAGVVDAALETECAPATGGEVPLGGGWAVAGMATRSPPLAQLVVARTSSTVDQVRFLRPHPYPLASGPCL